MVDKNIKEEHKTCSGLCKKEEAGVVIIGQEEIKSSVKIYDTAGETRIEVKSYGTDIGKAREEAEKHYDELKRKYK